MSNGRTPEEEQFTLSPGESRTLPTFDAQGNSVLYHLIVDPCPPGDASPIWPPKAPGPLVIPVGPTWWPPDEHAHIVAKIIGSMQAARFGWTENGVEVT